HTGQVEAGQRLLAEAPGAFEASGRGDLRAGADRLPGAFLLRPALPDAAPAGARFPPAPALAPPQPAEALGPRAAISLSRLWQRQGKRHEAHDLLAPIYTWFTEGFDTADLQEAQALLTALGGTERDKRPHPMFGPV